jgi:hypothetical protein
VKKRKEDGQKGQFMTGKEDWEEELETETREGMEGDVPPEEIGESMLTLSPSSLAQTTSTLAAREEGGGW